MGSHAALRASMPPSGRPCSLSAARHDPLTPPLPTVPPLTTGPPPLPLPQRVRDELKLIREATAAADARLTAEGIDPSTWPPPGMCSVHPKGGSGAAAGVGVRVMGGAALRADDVRIPLLG